MRNLRGIVRGIIFMHVNRYTVALRVYNKIYTIILLQNLPDERGKSPQISRFGYHPRMD